MADDDLPPGPGQLSLRFEHHASHHLDDFIVAEGNRLALERLLAYPSWPGPLTLIIGPPKSGKSHLARIWADLAAARSVTPEDLGSAAGNAAEDPVILEDLDRLAYEEHALFHLLNQSLRANRAVLLTARAEIDAWPFLTADVKSRARLASRFDVAQVDQERMAQLLVKLFTDRQVVVDARVIAYLTSRMERSHAEAVALVSLLDHLALARGKPISRALAGEALALRAAAHDHQDGFHEEAEPDQ